MIKVENNLPANNLCEIYIVLKEIIEIILILIIYIYIFLRRRKIPNKCLQIIQFYAEMFTTTLWKTLS